MEKPNNGQLCSAVHHKAVNYLLITFYFLYWELESYSLVITNKDDVVVVLIWQIN